MKHSLDKFKVVVHYIIANCGDPRKLGSIKLNKILWFADVFAYRYWEESITESEYVKMKFGPVPKRIQPVLSQLENERKISIKEQKVRYDPVIYTSLEDPDISVLSKDQIGLLNSLIDEICNEFSANEISRISHDDVWKSAVNGEEIPLEATLVNYGECTPEDLVWASQVIAENEH